MIDVMYLEGIFSDGHNLSNARYGAHFHIGEPLLGGEVYLGLYGQKRYAYQSWSILSLSFLFIFHPELRKD